MTTSFPKYLIFDCETTGLPFGRRVHVGNLKYWPHIVSLAWALYNEDQGLIDKQYYVIKPEGFQIPPESTKVHGITTEHALEHGEDLNKVMGEFFAAATKTEVLIAHNLAFDTEMIRAESIRLKLKQKADNKARICTMQATIDYCGIPFPSGDGFKFPRLEELYQKLFSEPMKDAHNALADVEACAMCFFELRERGVIK